MLTEALSVRAFISVFGFGGNLLGFCGFRGFLARFCGFQYALSLPSLIVQCDKTTTYRVKGCQLEVVSDQKAAGINSLIAL